LTQKVVGKKVKDLYHGAEVDLGTELFDDGADFTNNIGFFGCGEGAVGTGGNEFVDVDKLLVVLVQQNGGRLCSRKAGFLPLFFVYPEVEGFAVDTDTVGNFLLRKLGLEIEPTGVRFFVFKYGSRVWV
jgi:hypothetical protein